MKYLIFSIVIFSACQQPPTCACDLQRIKQLLNLDENKLVGSTQFVCGKDTFYLTNEVFHGIEANLEPDVPVAYQFPSTRDVFETRQYDIPSMFSFYNDSIKGGAWFKNIEGRYQKYENEYTLWLTDSSALYIQFPDTAYKVVFRYDSLSMSRSGNDQ